MQIIDLIRKVESLDGCTVFPSNGLPSLPVTVKLPDDLREFYQLCGGMILFEDQPHPVRLLPPQEFVSSPPVFFEEDILREETERGNEQLSIAREWFVLADLENTDYIVIDLNPQRSGRCYQAFWDSYAVVGETPIVAMSFTELLKRLIENRGEYWYFLEDDFEPFGDAFDEKNE